MEINVKKTVDNMTGFAAALKELTSRRVMVGVPAAESPRAGEGINNAALAYIHNFGAPEANIPARPFMDPGIKDVQDLITNQLKAAGTAAFDGNLEMVDQRMNRAGQIAASSVQEHINEGDFAPLQPATIAARKRAGHDGDKPLVVSGKMRDAITYVIRKK